MLNKIHKFNKNLQIQRLFSKIQLKDFQYNGQQISSKQLLIFSNQAQAPFSKFKTQISNSYKNYNHKISFFYQPEPEFIYDKGIHIRTKVWKNQQQFLKEDLFDKKLQLELQSSKRSPRVQLVGLEKIDHGLYLGDIIPFKDRNLNEVELRYNIQADIFQIRYSLNSLKKAGIENPEDFDLSSINMYDIKNYEADKIIYQIADKIYFPKESDRNEFLQNLLETDNIVSRILILKKKLHEIVSAMEILDQNLKQTDEQLYKSNTLVKARMTIDSIKNQYFHQEKAPIDENEIVKGFLDKLIMIPDQESRDKIEREIERFSFLDKGSSEYSKLFSYLEEVFQIPFQNKSQTNWNIKIAKDKLNEKIKGLDKVKERIIEMIASKKANEYNRNKGFVILLYGPPGVGKTSIAKAIGEALNKPSRMISFAGVNDLHFIKGHRRTYLDSQPGIFIKELIKSKVKDPVLIIDEVDKLNSFKGANPYYSLMEILNPEENANFTDHYLEIKVDFSECIFILTANEVLHLLEPLMNRLEIINVNAYIEEEKIEIAKSHLIPTLCEEFKLEKEKFQFNENILQKIIQGWCYYEGGVRELKRCIMKIIRKSIYQNQMNKQKNHADFYFNINDTQDIQEELVKYLGSPVKSFKQRENPEPGVVNILSASNFLGFVSQVECVYTFDEEQKGKINFSGNIMKVLQESVTVAKFNAQNFFSQISSSAQIEEVFKKNVHFHFLDGATKKDGPSAGPAIVTSYLSLLLNKPIPYDTGMTGEISLNGDIDKIGGVHSKLAAAKSHGLKNIFFPYTNIQEVQDLPDKLKKDLNLYFVKNYTQTFEALFKDNFQAIKDKIIDGVLYKEERIQEELKRPIIVDIIN